MIPVSLVLSRPLQFSPASTVMSTAPSTKDRPCPLRGAPGIFAIIGLHSVFFLSAVIQIVGGTPTSSTEGKYVLEYKGYLNKVPQHVWRIMGILEWAHILSFVLVFGALAMGMYADRRRWQWYKESSDYSISAVISVLLGFAMVLIANFISVGWRWGN